MAVSAPKDKRFHRAHVSPRARGRFRLARKHIAVAIVSVAGIVYGSYRIATLVLSAEMLTVTRITVTGNAWLSKGDVLSMLEGLQGRNMLLVNLDDWRGKVLASPWVADVAIRRVLPGTVDVVVAERRPIGIARLSGTLYLMDERGRLIDKFGPNHAGLDLPLIDGLAAGPKGPAPQDVSGAGPSAIDQARAALATRLLASLQEHPALAARVSQVDVTDVRDAAVILKDDTALVRVGDDQFAERLQSYLDLAGTLRERVQDIDYVDLRFGDRVYVRPQPAGPRPQKTTGGS